MAERLAARSPGRLKLILKRAVRARGKFLLLLFLVTMLSCSVISPAFTRASTGVVEGSPSSLGQQNLVNQGKALYVSGQLTEAVKVLQRAVQDYQAQGDSLGQALALSNLSLVYQQLGQWSEATQSINTSLQLLGYQNPEKPRRSGESRPANLNVLAQTLDIQGAYS